MSLAWSTLIVLLLLLPGVLFFAGQYLDESFTRETVERSALGQLAGTMLVAWFVHVVLYSVWQIFLCDLQLGSAQGTGRRYVLPCISITRLLEVVTLDDATPTAIRRVGKTLSEFAPFIISYFFAASALGLALGREFGIQVARRFRQLSQHSWVFDLKASKSTDGARNVLPRAFVLTNIREGNRILLYYGFLKTFGLRRDGQFSYLVLIGAARRYLVLAERGAHTVEAKDSLESALGRPALAHANRPSPRALIGRGADVEALFHIEGEDIANCYFDRFDVAEASPLSEVVREVDREILEAIGAAGAAVDAPSSLPSSSR